MVSERLLYTCLITLMSFLMPDTDEELKEWQTKFQERIALLQSKISKLERDAEDATTMSTFLSKGINDYIRETGKLQAEAEV